MSHVENVIQNSHKLSKHHGMSEKDVKKYDMQIMEQNSDFFPDDVKKKGSRIKRSGSRIRKSLSSKNISHRNSTHLTSHNKSLDENYEKTVELDYDPNKFPVYSGNKSDNIILRGSFEITTSSSNNSETTSSSHIKDKSPKLIHTHEDNLLSFKRNSTLIMNFEQSRSSTDQIANQLEIILEEEIQHNKTIIGNKNKNKKPLTQHISSRGLFDIKPEEQNKRKRSYKTKTSVPSPSPSYFDFFEIGLEQSIHEGKKSIENINMNTSNNMKVRKTITNKINNKIDNKNNSKIDIKLEDSISSDNEIKMEYDIQQKSPSIIHLPKRLKKNSTGYSSNENKYNSSKDSKKRPVLKRKMSKTNSLTNIRWNKVTLSRKLKNTRVDIVKIVFRYKLTSINGEYYTFILFYNNINELYFGLFSLDKKKKDFHIVNIIKDVYFFSKFFEDILDNCQTDKSELITNFIKYKISLLPYRFEFQSSSKLACILIGMSCDSKNIEYDVKIFNSEIEVLFLMTETQLISWCKLLLKRLYSISVNRS